MKAHSPCYLWWPKDYLTDPKVMALNLAEEGAYRRLLDICWMEGSIPADFGPLLKIGREFEELVNLDRLRALFTELDGGALVSPKMERVREDMEARAEARKERAQRAAEARWDAARSKRAEAMLEHSSSTGQAMLGNANPYPVPDSVPKPIHPPTQPLKSTGTDRADGTGTSVPLDVGSLIDKIANKSKEKYGGK